MIDPRKSKSEVEYQATQKARMRCDICKGFEYPDACKSVKGPISVSGWCRQYRHRDAKAKQA